MHDSSPVSQRRHGRIRNDAERGTEDGWRYVTTSVLQSVENKRRTEMRSWRGYKLVK